MSVVLSHHCAANPRDLKLMRQSPKGQERVGAGSCHDCQRIVFLSPPCIRRSGFPIKSQATVAMEKHFRLRRNRVFFNHTAKSQLLSQHDLEYTQTLPVPFPGHAAARAHTIKSIRLPNSTQPKQEIRWIAFWHIYLTLALLIFILLLLGGQVENE